MDGFHEINIIDSDNFSVEFTTSSVGALTGNFNSALTVKRLTLSALPATFLQNNFFDFVQNVSPNKIIHYDRRFNAINQVSKQISFIATDIPDVIVGSYIT